MNIFYLKNNIKLKENVNWTNPSVVGEAANPTYNGREVILMTPTLTAFKDYMNSLTLSFDFDHAIGLFKLN
jgi:hypothetical protein